MAVYITTVAVIGQNPPEAEHWAITDTEVVINVNAIYRYFLSLLCKRNQNWLYQQGPAFRDKNPCDYRQAFRKLI